MMAISPGNFRKAEEASNAEGTTKAALDFAMQNAKKNPTKANLAILAQTGSARAETTAKQTKNIQDVIAGIPDTVAETQRIIDEANAATTLTNSLAAEAKAITPASNNNDSDTKKADAYQRLYDEFNGLGLGALVEDAKKELMKATSVAAMPDALRNTETYKQRFSANDARIKAGLAALSPAQYLAKEDAYQNIMRNYGLPESYYKTGLYGKQEGFDTLLANDVSSLELENRIATAQQRVLNSNPEVLNAIKNFYGDSVTNGDILAYALNPQKGLEDIKKKVTAAEIQGAANVFGLNKITKESTPAEIQALEARANALAGYGVDKAAAIKGFETVADLAPRGSQLAEIYKQAPYTQGTAEAEVFKTAGAAEAKEKRRKLTALETAKFSGSSGVGALGRDRATNYGTTQSGFGQY